MRVQGPGFPARLCSHLAPWRWACASPPDNNTPPRLVPLTVAMNSSPQPTRTPCQPASWHTLAVASGTPSPRQMLITTSLVRWENRGTGHQSRRPSSFLQLPGVAQAPRGGAATTTPKGAVPAPAHSMGRARVVGSTALSGLPLSCSTQRSLVSRPKPLARCCCPPQTRRGRGRLGWRAGQPHSETTSWAARRK